MTSTTLALLERLIGFPSVSVHSNLDLIQWVQEYLQGYGVQSRLTFDDDRRKANLFATIGEGDGGLILSGHTDVVPVDGQDWTGDPFKAWVKDNKVFGRGACDMKGFIAVALAAVPEMVASKRRSPMHLAFSYDEELGCRGVPRLIADLKTQVTRPSGCIVGEPTSMQIVVGHKGGGMYIYTVKGRAIHSSLAPFGVNAIEYGALIIQRFRQIAERLLRDERREPSFDIPHSTIQINRISGGTAGNIVAEHCEIVVDVRNLPWTKRETLIAEVEAYIETDLLPKMREIAPEAAVSMHEAGNLPPFSIDEDAPLVRHVQHTGRTNQKCGYVAFGTEAGLFQQADIPTIVCGPGSIEQAHRPDEFVAIDQLERCERMISDLIQGAPLPIS